MPLPLVDAWMRDPIRDDASEDLADAPAGLTLLPCGARGLAASAA
eukprot:CAMPEP_0195043688 /NCGR_PEP_ID=MMETSP0347-20130606/5306_1 /TAXON_ID=2932 /ORGANISM="Alexandrium fundyense, Strain CCMP1719" /LENGTH=44 /DNA_ID= /DNA_START= /DNA_END= /DNA_ORIENTATION=